MYQVGKLFVICCARHINSMGARPDDYVVVLLSEGTGGDIGTLWELFDFEFGVVIV